MSAPTHRSRWTHNRIIGAFALLLTITGAQAQPAAELSCDRIEVFVRAGCPHCAAAKEYLAELEERFPALTVRYWDVREEQEAARRFVELMEKGGVDRPGVPAMDLCGQVLIGFDQPATTGAYVEAVLTGRGPVLAAKRQITLPLFGSVSAGDLGLPLFTIAVGLVDGFNPCAMWVLLFLLSLLVNVRRRSRIVMVAGTFVLISGLVYFAFMAAWLNAFLILGYSRALQLFLGTLALLIGVVHVKDFFALHRGPSLSIPDRVKPGLYAHMRRVIHAENLALALAGVSLLAILVNFIELLCTAGLPALYTQILTLHDLSPGGYYGYLALYNLAYIVDDGLMVTLAVITLGKRKLQEREGRWLKLLSGAIISVLGLLLLLAPEFLVF